MTETFGEVLPNCRSFPDLEELVLPVVTEAAQSARLEFLKTLEAPKLEEVYFWNGEVPEEDVTDHHLILERDDGSKVYVYFETERASEVGMLFSGGAFRGRVKTIRLDGWPLRLVAFTPGILFDETAAKYQLVETVPHAIVVFQGQCLTEAYLGARDPQYEAPVTAVLPWTGMQIALSRKTCREFDQHLLCALRGVPMKSLAIWHGDTLLEKGSPLLQVEELKFTARSMQQARNILSGVFDAVSHSRLKTLHCEVSSECSEDGGCDEVGDLKGLDPFLHEIFPGLKSTQFWSDSFQCCF